MRTRLAILKSERFGEKRKIQTTTTTTHRICSGGPCEIQETLSNPHRNSTLYIRSRRSSRDIARLYNNLQTHTGMGIAHTVRCPARGEIQVR